MNENNIKYIISTYPSEFSGYQAKQGTNGSVKIFISNIWNRSENFEDFVKWIDFFLLLERICLERGFQKIKMKNRCNPCKMERYAFLMKFLSK